MIKVIVTIIIAVVVGVVLGIIEVKLNKKVNNVSVVETNDFVGKEMIQRRGSWRYALDQILYSSALYKEIEDEANIKVH